MFSNLEVFKCKGNMADDFEPSQSHKGERLSKYELKFKVNAIVFAEKTNNMAASRKFNMDVKRIRVEKKQGQGCVFKKKPIWIEMKAT